MKTLYGITITAALGVALLVPSGLHAQNPQQSRMQQHMQQLEQQMQRMDGMRDRLHRLDGMLARQMDGMRDAQRIREHEHLREMCLATDNMVGQLRRSMEQAREMARERVFQDDPEMQRQMERLRQHWDEVANQLEQGLDVMERLQQRLGRPDGGG